VTEPELSDNDVRRYIRQLVIPAFGQRGQLALKRAAVLVAGAGGLGSPVITYLAAAGVGRLGIADPDSVTMSNLNRQIIYHPGILGAGKAVAAAQFAKALNPDVEVVTHPEVIGLGNALSLVEGYDVIVDGTDNLLARRAIAGAALAARKPLVSGAVGQLEGHVSVFPPIGVGVPSGFEALFPSQDTPPSCEAVGVIGAVTGVIGSLMAMETIKLLSSLGQPLVRRAVRYEARAGTFSEITLDRGARVRALVGG
jgi:molybdopterin/thiamine biosynthesis adenylyltransferase